MSKKEPEPTNEVITVNEMNVYLQIVIMVLQGEYKWRFDMGGTVITASILDDKFISRITKGEEVFRNGDFLKVKLKVTQKSGKLMLPKTEYEILDVSEHVHNPQQMHLLSHSEPETGNEAVKL